MDQAGDQSSPPSEMLISPRWSFLLSILLIVNLSLAAWAAAFVPDVSPASVRPAHIAGAQVAGGNNAAPAALVPAVAATENSPSLPSAAENPNPLASHEEPVPMPSIQAEWTPEPSPPEPRESVGPGLPGETAQTAEPQDPPAAEPAPDSRPSAAETSAPEVPAGLVIINPPSTGGTVHFLFEGDVITLQPGEFHVVAEIEERVLKFDRGEDFGVVEQKVVDEVWKFAVGPRGWQFQLVDRERAAKHLEGCRPRSVSTEPSAEPATSEP